MDFYSIARFGHLIFVIAWMAGLMYLPRLFAYHALSAVGSDIDRQFQVMEARLLRIIMNPAMLASWGFGLWLFALRGFVDGPPLWALGKVGLAVAMTIVHMVFANWRKQFAQGNNPHSNVFYRVVNETPFLIAIAAIFLVVFEPG
ncbi:MAG TPA: TIGR00701 family protein [Hyphomonadaceae bacterium]|nr:TIGR00701 family protein [Hyphomonadaceae bacterium]